MDLEGFAKNVDTTREKIVELYQKFFPYERTEPLSDEEFKEFYEAVNPLYYLIGEMFTEVYFNKLYLKYNSDWRRFVHGNTNIMAMDADHYIYFYLLRSKAGQYKDLIYYTDMAYLSNFVTKERIHQLTEEEVVFTIDMVMRVKRQKRPDATTWRLNPKKFSEFLLE